MKLQVMYSVLYFVTEIGTKIVKSR